MSRNAETWIGRRLSVNGCFTWSDLLGRGLTPAMIRTRVRRGELVRMHHQVYTVAEPDLIPLCHETAAVLSLGEDAVLSHRSAAVVWGLTDRIGGVVEVTVTRNPRPRRGVRIHRVKHLDRADSGYRSKLRITSVGRTVIDFAADASLDELEEAIALGMANHGMSRLKLEQAMNRAPDNHPGTAAVRRLFARDGGPVVTRSGGERRLRALLRDAGLPQPVSNHMLHGFQVDLYWPEYNLVVELDSFPFHSKRRTFERDRLKAQVLGTKGMMVVPLTGRQLRDEPFAVIARLAQVLVSRAA